MQFEQELFHESYAWPNAQVGTITVGLGTAQVVLRSFTTAPALPSQSMHTGWPEEGWYFPSAHSEQESEVEFELRPAAHGWQEEDGVGVVVENA